ncbi:hypothetical protein E2320_016269 [Naja naja]|nr:hypothetical protein E2320_016269 [Naja naja]
MGCGGWWQGVGRKSSASSESAGKGAAWAVDCIRRRQERNGFLPLNSILAKATIMGASAWSTVSTNQLF